MTLAVIPARGGSKGVPRKNVRILGGLPLLVHTLRAARAATRLDRILVSTEDEEIAGVARSEGAEVLSRPLSLAGDQVQNTDVIRHALEQAGQGFDRVVLLQPTSPLRTAQDIDACVQLLDQSDTASAMTVTTVEHHPAKVVRLDAQGEAVPFTSWSDMEARRQELPTLYRQNGAVYALRTSDFLRENRFILAPCRVYVMSSEASVDIDNELDFLIAEQLLRSRGSLTG
jgi:CMP-N-acetylneuraminic acid synthetase